MRRKIMKLDYLSSFFIVVFAFVLMGPFIGTIYTAVYYESYNVFKGLIFGYMFGLIPAFLAGIINWALIVSYVKKGLIGYRYVAIYQGIKCALITLVILAVIILLTKGMPSDWLQKLIWLSSTCFISSLTCSLIINRKIAVWINS